MNNQAYRDTPQGRINIFIHSTAVLLLISCSASPPPKAPGAEPTSYVEMQKGAEQSRESKASSRRQASTAPQPSAQPAAPPPWPTLSSMVSDKSLHPLQKWLAKTQAPASLTPSPPYTKKAAAYINQWHSFAPMVTMKSQNEQLPINTMLLLSTFWLRGLQIDQDTSIKEMSKLLINAKTTDPTHPLPFALEALFFLHHPGHSNVEEAFQEALSRNPSDKLKQLLHMGYGLLCRREGNLHQSILQYQEAAKVQPIPKRYHPLFVAARQSFVLPADAEFTRDNTFSQLGSTFSAGPFGFHFSIPVGWRIAQAASFTSQKQEAIVRLELAQTPYKQTDVRRSPIVIVVETIDGDMRNSPHLTPNSSSATTMPLPLPIDHAHFTKWFRFDAPTISDTQNNAPTTLAAVAEVLSAPWHQDEHLRAAAQEGACAHDNQHRQLSFSMDEHTDSTELPRSASRVNLPLRIIVLTGSTEKQLENALSQLTELVNTFQISDKSGTELLNTF